MQNRTHCLVVSSFRSIPTPRLMPDGFQNEESTNTDSKINFFETSVESHLKYHKLSWINSYFIATFNQTATVMNLFFRCQLEYPAMPWVEMCCQTAKVKRWFSKGSLPKKALILNWAMKKKPWLFRVYRGWNPAQWLIGIIINHYNFYPRHPKRQFYIICHVILMHAHIDVFYDYMDRHDYVCNTSYCIWQQSYHQAMNIMHTTPT